jgi:DNA-binding NarL/FixJ family response regulator
MTILHCGAACTACYQDIQVAGEAESGAAAVQAALTLRLDVILLDIELPGPNGVEVVHQLNREAPEAKIIILTAFDSNEYLLGALKAGAYAYLLKSTSDETVVDTIRQVHRGRRRLSATQLATVLQHFETTAKSHALHEAGLSAQELDMLDLIARERPPGRSGNRCIAAREL